MYKVEIINIEGRAIKIFIFRKNAYRYFVDSLQNILYGYVKVYRFKVKMFPLRFYWDIIHHDYKPTIIVDGKMWGKE